MKLLEDFFETDNRQLAIDYLSYETWSITTSMNSAELPCPLENSPEYVSGHIILAFISSEVLCRSTKSDVG